MLDFQHIIQVNDLNNANVAMINRSQLWQGLLLRAREPQRFNESLQCVSSALADNQFTRRVSAGDAAFEERVVLTPNVKIETSTVASPDQISAKSFTLIEEPEPNSLFVRFRYQRDLDAGSQEMQVAEFLKSAYVQLDRDAVDMIRMMAHNGSFISSAD